MHPNKKIIIALMGPTASGKTNLGIKIAKKFNFNIHNVDSRQIYIDMNIGTAKPTSIQQKEVPHFLISLCSPTQPINLHEFHELASSSMQKDFKKHKVVFLVGGSGLYLQALLGKIELPKVPPQQFLRNQLTKLDKLELHQLLANCDRIAADKIHPSDSIRMIRAIEVFYATGKTFSQQIKSREPSWKILELGLNPKNLKQRIHQRTENMYKNGLIEETQALILKYGNDLQLLRTIGYAEARSIIDGTLSCQEGIEITKQRTTQFAKRQKTWFKNKHNPKWLNDENPLEDSLSSIYEVLGY